MATRIWMQRPYTREVPYYPDDGYEVIGREQSKIYSKVLHADTVIAQNNVPRSTYVVNSIYLELLNNAEIVRGIIEGEKQGYDVAVVSSGDDAGVVCAREVVKIPVVGMTEAAMHLACQLGSKFALITINDKCVPILERNLKLSGMEDRAITRKPARAIDDPNWESITHQLPNWFASLDYAREHVIPAFEKVAKECIEDGAEVICTAAGPLGVLSLAEYNKVSGTEVPVIECIAAGVKMAELLGDMNRLLNVSTSKHLTYQSLPPEMIEMLSAPFFPKQ